MHAMRHLLLAFGLVALSSAAGGQCRLCEKPTMSQASPDSTNSGDVEVQIETSLNFDRLILSGSGPGAVTILPDGSSGVE